MKILVTGGAGYIGSHLVDYLIGKGHEVVVIDNMISGKIGNLNPKSILFNADVNQYGQLNDGYGNPEIFSQYKFDSKIFSVSTEHRTLLALVEDIKPDIIFHLAAVSRTPWAISDPIYTYETNVVGSANVLEAARQVGVKKVVLASSNIVYAAQTPYKTSKLAMEQVARDYNDLYDLPTVCLRFSNVAGGHIERQHDDNVLKALAKSKKEKGYIEITGDGKQIRNFTNVMDVCEALYKASGIEQPQWVTGYAVGGDYDKLQVVTAFEKIRGTEIDIMHPKEWNLNDIAKMFDCEIRYIDERKGDIKNLKMGIGPKRAEELLGFTAKIDLMDYISLYTNV